MLDLVCSNGESVLRRPEGPIWNLLKNALHTVSLSISLYLAKHLAAVCPKEQIATMNFKREKMPSKRKSNDT